MRENGETEKLTDKANCTMQMVISMKVNGKMIKQMETELILTQTEQNM